VSGGYVQKAEPAQLVISAPASDSWPSTNTRHSSPAPEFPTRLPALADVRQAFQQLQQ